MILVRPFLKFNPILLHVPTRLVIFQVFLFKVIHVINNTSKSPSTRASFGKLTFFPLINNLSSGMTNRKMVFSYIKPGYVIMTHFKNILSVSYKVEIF